MPAHFSELASLTTYFCGGVLWDHRVSGELWMEDAAVRVSVHGQTIQQLTVLLHTIVERWVCIRNQLSHRVCGVRRPHENMNIRETSATSFHQLPLKFLSSSISLVATQPLYDTTFRWTHSMATCWHMTALALCNTRKAWHVSNTAEMWKI